MLLSQLDIASLDMFASQTRDLYHIELPRSGNISSLSEAKAYRVNGVNISTKAYGYRVERTHESLPLAKIGSSPRAIPTEILRFARG